MNLRQTDRQRIEKMADNTVLVLMLIFIILAIPYVLYTQYETIAGVVFWTIGFWAILKPIWVSSREAAKAEKKKQCAIVVCCKHCTCTCFCGDKEHLDKTLQGLKTCDHADIRLKDFNKIKGGQTWQ